MIDEFAVWDHSLASENIMTLARGFICSHGCHIDGPIGELNEDGVINELDYHILVSNLNAHLDREVSYLDGDIDFNGAVDLNDFGLFKSLYPGVVAAATRIPEPGTLGLATLMLMALLAACRGQSPRVFA